LTEKGQKGKQKGGQKGSRVRIGKVEKNRSER
jgi:hypothetical protein